MSDHDDSDPIHAAGLPRRFRGTRPGMDHDKTPVLEAIDASDPKVETCRVVRG